MFKNVMSTLNSEESTYAVNAANKDNFVAMMAMNTKTVRRS